MNITIGISGTFLANLVTAAVRLTLLKCKVLQEEFSFILFSPEEKTPIQLIKSILISVSSLFSRFHSILSVPSKCCVVLVRNCVKEKCSYQSCGISFRG